MPNRRQAGHAKGTSGATGRVLTIEKLKGNCVERFQEGRCPRVGLQLS